MVPRYQGTMVPGAGQDLDNCATVNAGLDGCRAPSAPPAALRYSSGMTAPNRMLSLRASLHYLATHEKQHSGEPSARRTCGSGQPSVGGADLPVGQVLVR